MIAPVHSLRPIRLAGAQFAGVIASYRAYFANLASHPGVNFRFHIESRLEEQVKPGYRLTGEDYAKATYAAVTELHHQPGAVLRPLRQGAVRTAQQEQQRQDKYICNYFRRLCHNHPEFHSQEEHQNPQEWL
jgi:hypothetical protein